MGKVVHEGYQRNPTITEIQVQASGQSVSLPRRETTDNPALQMAVKLLVGIITFNEIRNIGCCLEFVRGVANEVVVVDSFSRDPTREVREIGQDIPGH